MPLFHFIYLWMLKYWAVIICRTHRNLIICNPTGSSTVAIIPHRLVGILSQSPFLCSKNFSDNAHRKTSTGSLRVPHCKNGNGFQIKTHPEKTIYFWTGWTEKIRQKTQKCQIWQIPRGCVFLWPKRCNQKQDVESHEIQTQARKKKNLSFYWPPAAISPWAISVTVKKTTHIYCIGCL